MAEKRNPLGATGETVRANVRRLREAQNLGYAELSRRLRATGREIAELGLRRIEEGNRRVDTDDLMALAAALGVSPITLLMAEVSLSEWDAPTVAVTGVEKTVSAQALWNWLTAQAPPDESVERHPMWVARSVPNLQINLRVRQESDHGND